MLLDTHSHTNKRIMDVPLPQDALLQWRTKTLYKKKKKKINDGALKGNENSRNLQSLVITYKRGRDDLSLRELKRAS